MFDMNQCKPGDKLVSCHGAIFTYIGIQECLAPFRHVVEYPDGGKGTRADNGKTYLNCPLSVDHDIVGFAEPDHANLP